MRNLAISGLLGLTTLLAVGACGDSAIGDGGATAVPDVRLAGRAFVTTGDVGIPGGGPLSLEFTEDDRLLATAGCNSMNGPVSLDGGRLVAAELAMTEMGCSPEVMESDQWMSDLLLARPGWELRDDDTLVLTEGDRVVELTDRDVVHPPAELTGHAWTLDTLIKGDGVSSLPAGVDAELTITAEGKVTGHGGCNGFGGNAVVSGGTITFGDIVSTAMGCSDEIGQVESHLLSVLDGEVRFSISGDRLTLTAGNGDGIQATAD